jgi:hypothetical protein
MLNNYPFNKQYLSFYAIKKVLTPFIVDNKARNDFASRELGGKRSFSSVAAERNFVVRGAQKKNKNFVQFFCSFRSRKCSSPPTNEIHAIAVNYTVHYCECYLYDRHYNVHIQKLFSGYSNCQVRGMPHVR